ncbi:MAG: glycoside hydrolase family 99-like domain-containing protein [Saccharofermentanales bacterium]
MYGFKTEDYVPEPQPVKSDYVIACHYFPGWKPGSHRGFDAIWNYPERTPLMGYYDESNPEVTDWEIKWAVEHGVNCFIYCWYRRNENVGKPVTLESLNLAHEIHEGLFNARYKDMMKFAIMWEAGNAGGIENVEDLLNNLMPFWIENYFTKPNYLVIDNKPVLFVYDYFLKIMNAAGSSPEDQKKAFEQCSEMVKEYGFDGITFQVEYRYEDLSILQKLKDGGYDQAFAYCWHTLQQYPTDKEVIERQMHLMTMRESFDPYFTILTCSQAWDPHPWATPEKKDTVTRWKLSPDNWRSLLERVKGLAESLPEDALGHRLIMLDNWNEWSEGHYISPHLSGGFKYLQAVREVFTKRDNLPDYRLPDVLGLGPYDQLWKKPNG